MDKNQEQQKPAQEPGIGRTFNRGPQSNEPEHSGSGRNDISSMDQQEGLMNNGETGGGGSFNQQGGSSNPNE